MEAKKGTKESSRCEGVGGFGGEGWGGAWEMVGWGRGGTGGGGGGVFFFFFLGGGVDQKV